MNKRKIQPGVLPVKTLASLCLNAVLDWHICTRGLLTHSSFLSSAGFPSGCYKPTLWSSSHCRSGLLAEKDEKRGWNYLRLTNKIQSNPLRHTSTQSTSEWHPCTKAGLAQWDNNTDNLHTFVVQILTNVHAKFFSKPSERRTFEMISEMFLSDCLMGYFAMSHWNLVM